MLTRISAAALILSALPSAWALDPAMLNLVAPGATFIAGADTARLQTSPIGQKMFASVVKEMANFDKIASATGFDPRRDLQEVLISSGNMNQRSGVVIARGAFDQQRLTSMARTAGAISSTYKGTNLFQSDANSHDVAAFVAGYLVAGSKAEVEAVIDRTASRTATSPLTARAQVASARYDAWVVTAAPADLAQAIPGGGHSSSLPLQGVSTLSGGARFGNDLDLGIEAETRSAQDANALVDVVRLFSALMQPNANGGNGLGNFFNSLNLTTEGSIVRATARVTAAELDQLMKGGPAQNSRPRRVAQR